MKLVSKSFLCMWTLLACKGLMAQVEVSPFLTQPILKTTAYPHIQKSATSPAALTFAQAVSSCRNLIWNGDSNWYLPTTDELILFANAADDQNPLVSCITVTDPLTLMVNGIDFYNGKGDTAAGSYMCQAYYNKFGSLTRSLVDGSGGLATYPIGGTLANETTLGLTTAANVQQISWFNPANSYTNVGYGRSVAGTANHFSRIIYPFKFAQGLDSLYFGVGSNKGSFPTIHGDFYQYEPYDYLVRTNQGPAGLGVGSSGYIHNWILGQNLHAANASPFINATATTPQMGANVNGNMVFQNHVDDRYGDNTSSNAKYYLASVGYVAGGKEAPLPTFYKTPITISESPAMNMANPAYISAVDISQSNYTNVPREINFHYHFSVNNVVVVGTALTKDDFQTSKANSLLGMANFMLHTPSSSQKNGAHCVRNYGN